MVSMPWTGRNDPRASVGVCASTPGREDQRRHRAERSRERVGECGIESEIERDSATKIDGEWE